MDKLADNRLIMSMYTSFDPIYCRRCVTSTGQTVISKKYGEYSVAIVKSTENDGYVERIISITDKVGILKYCFLLTSYHFFPQSGKPHQVTQFQILNWNSQGKCSCPQTIITVVEEVNKVQRRTDNKPIVVHCRSAAITTNTWWSCVSLQWHCQ